MVGKFNSITVAAIQMVSGPKVEENLCVAARLIGQAVEAGAKLILLPEYFALMGLSDQDKLDHAEEQGKGPIQDFLSQISARHQIWLAGGTLPLKSGQGDKVRNTLLVFDPAGTCVSHYDKIHLFGFKNGTERYCEADSIVPGHVPVAFSTPFGRIGLSVCYDLRFPELFRALGEIDILLLPAAFTATTGRAHWEVLLRARAIENQCFVVASDQGGTHPSGRQTYGHSMLIDPWGQILDCLDQGEGVIVGELKASQLERVRKSLPALSHRVM